MRHSNRDDDVFHDFSRARFSSFDLIFEILFLSLSFFLSFFLSLVREGEITFSLSVENLQCENGEK